MADFALSEGQQALRDLARDFAQREIVPLAPELDREQRHSGGIVEKCYNLGLLHYGAPKEYGGGGLGSLEGCLIAEELGAACAGVGVGLYGNILGLLPLLIAGSPELKEELLLQRCSGPNLAALCLTEAGAGSDVASIRARARRSGEEYIIEGIKRFITNGGEPLCIRCSPRSSSNWGIRAYQPSLFPAIPLSSALATQRTRWASALPIRER